MRAVLLFIAWAGLVPFLLMFMSLVLYSWRYAYAPVTYEPLTVWGRNEESWVNPYTLLNSSLGYDDLDDFGGGYFAQFFVWWWVPAFTSILALTLIPTVPYVRRVGTRGALSNVIHQVRAVGGYQLPPRKLWMRLMGGLTVTESVLLACWIAVHAVMLWNWYWGYTTGYRYVDEVVGVDFGIPRKQVNLERAALSAGWLCLIDFAVLFWPLAHNSFLHTLTGIPYSGLIRFHQWVGHTTMWSTTLHGVLYYIYWGIRDDGGGWKQFRDFGDLQAINNLAGTISWIFGLALWVTSVDWFRRRYHQSFHTVHMLGFLGFTLFALLHYPGMWVGCVPGLLLYAADIAMRMTQASNITTITGWRVIGKGQNRAIVFTLPVDKGVEQKPLHDYFINFPGVSRWHWHPLTCLYPQGEQGHPGSTVTFAMKQKGLWSTAVIEEIIKTEHVPVRVNGPMGGESILAQGYDHLLMIAGGIAAVPLLSVIEDMVHQRQGGVNACIVPATVRLIWTAREREEFTLISESIMAAAGCGDGWLQIELVFSGSVTVPVGQNLKGLPQQLEANTLEAEGAAINSLVKSRPEGKSFIKEANGVVSLSSRPQSGGCPLKFPGTSALFWDRVRPIQPKIVNRWYFLAVTAISFFGGLCGVVLGYAFYHEYWSRYPINSRYWQFGGVIFCTVTVCAVGLPLAMVIFPVQFVRYLMSGTKKARAETAQIMSQGMARTASLLMDETVGFPESGMSLPIKVGSVDIPAVLQDTASQLSQKGRVGLYCGGPETMVRFAALTAWGLNDKKQGAYLHMHRASWEL
ncbi:hypothetical protein ABBQ38_014960 [Trebouxia sp. C0009 RCD-2024]